MNYEITFKKQKSIRNFFIGNIKWINIFRCSGTFMFFILIVFYKLDKNNYFFDSEIGVYELFIYLISSFFIIILPYFIKNTKLGILFSRIYLDDEKFKNYITKPGDIFLTSTFFLIYGAFQLVLYKILNIILNLKIHHKIFIKSLPAIFVLYIVAYLMKVKYNK